MQLAVGERLPALLSVQAFVQHDSEVCLTDKFQSRRHSTMGEKCAQTLPPTVYLSIKCGYSKTLTDGACWFRYTRPGVLPGYGAIMAVDA